jgi:hypothetical protein
MRKFIVAATAALTIVVPAIAIPAIASASTGTVARSLQVRWGNEIRQNARLRGMRVTQATVRGCASGGGGYYTCYGTYTVTRGGMYAKYGTNITVANGVWRSTNGQLLNQW